MEPMTVQQIVGSDGDDVLGDIVSELVGVDAPNKPTTPTPAGQQPEWQKYLNLVSTMIPVATEQIVKATKKDDKPAEPPKTDQKTPATSEASAWGSSQSFLSQDIGPLPLWGWTLIVTAAGGGFWWWKKHKKV